MQVRTNTDGTTSVIVTVAPLTRAEVGEVLIGAYVSMMGFLALLTLYVLARRAINFCLKRLRQHHNKNTTTK